LGLYIARKIVEGCGGELKLENSVIGKGTTFSFIVPVFAGQVKVEGAADDKAAAELKTKKILKTKTKHKPTVLLIEDQQLLVEMYASYFKSHGFDFYSVSDVKTALEEIKSVVPSVVLLDIILPQKREDGSVYTVSEQGWSFLEIVKQDPATAKIPVVIFTNLNTYQDREKAKKLGADAYVFKGNTEPKDLIKVIEGLIKK
jgi:CheY-like chemotaxis protein